MKNFLLAALLFLVPFQLQAGSSLIEEFDQLDIGSIQLASVSAAVVKLDTGEILYQKNGRSVRPIASITKLMTAMVVLDAAQPLDEMLTVTEADRDLVKHTWSRVRFGSSLSRRDMLLIALMSSENRAASALGRHYPGGIDAFVDAMNAKADALGMHRTRFVDSTGLSPGNVSSAADLVKLVRAAAQYPLITNFTTQPSYVAQFHNPRYDLEYVNTNILVRRGSWDIGLSKTGYIREAGRCLVMLTEVQGQRVAMVMLDSYGKWTPVGDAGRIRQWINTGESGPIAAAALRYEQSRSSQAAAGSVAGG